MEMILGIILVMVAGMLTGTFMWPMKVIRRLCFEHYWFIGMFCGLLLLPWLVVAIFVPNVGQVIADIGYKPLLTANILSAGWGIANVLFGICIIRIGAALAGGLLTSLGVSAGVLIPMFFKGSGLFGQAPSILSKPGIIVLIGVGIILAGVVFIAIAGFGREKALVKASPGAKSVKSGTFLSGLIMAIIAGILSSCISLSFVYSQGPVIAAVKSQGAGELVANVSVWAMGLLGGVLVNLLYPLWLMIKNHSGKALFTFSKETVFAAVIGVQLLCGAIMLGRGMVLLGALGASVGFGIQQSLQIMGNQAVGFISGEWRGVHGRPRNILFTAIGIFIVAVIILAFANALMKQ